MSSQDAEGEIITFYSYKGGTGRTMALSNVACILARKNPSEKGILMIDWDLEAPGLHRFFEKKFMSKFAQSSLTLQELFNKPGLIDLFLKIDSLTPKNGYVNEEEAENEAYNLFDYLELEDFIIETDIPNLSLIKAGCYDDNYANKVNFFDWLSLYKRSPWIFTAFAEKLETKYRYILIDSRSGYTDISGICTMLMPQKLVTVFVPNKQNCIGSLELIKKAIRYRRYSDDLRPLIVYPLPSRIESSINELRSAWRLGNSEIVGYQPSFEEVIQNEYEIPECNLNNYFNDVQIQQLPYYAYGEQIAVEIENIEDRFSLSKSYKLFTDYLIESKPPWIQRNETDLPYLSERLKNSVMQNRSGDIKSALTYLSNHGILVFSGLDGVGKSTLARALAEVRPPAIPLPFWYDFNKNKDSKLEDILSKLADYMKSPNIAKFSLEGRKAGKEDIKILINELKINDTIWLFFDNLDIVLNDRAFIDPEMDLLFTSLCYDEHKAKIIMTTKILPTLRNGDSLIDHLKENVQKIKGLRVDFAKMYLIQNGLNLNDAKLEEIIKNTDGHPLALKIYIGLCKDFGIDILDDLSVYKASKENSIKKARRLFDKLSTDEKRLLENISVYRRPEPKSAIEIMFTQKIEKNTIKKLIDKSLLENDNYGNYWLHPLVQEFSYDDLKEKEKIHQIAYEFYLKRPLETQPKMKADVQSLIEAHYHACMSREYDKAADIIFDYKLDEKLDKWGNYATLVELYSMLLPQNYLSDKTFLTNSQKHCQILEKLGNAFSDLGQVDKSLNIYKKILSIARETGDRFLEGTQFGNIANSYYLIGELRTSVEYYKKALDIFREIRNRREEGKQLENLGNVCLELGSIPEALKSFQESYKISKEHSPRNGVAIDLGNLGNVYLELGETHKAREHYQKALELSRNIGNRREEGNQLGNIGNAERKSGKKEDLRKATKYYQEALKIAQEIGDKRGEENQLGNLAHTFHQEKRYEEAIKYYKEALNIAEEIRDNRGKEDLLGYIGNTYQLLGEVTKSIEYYQEALKIAERLNENHKQGIWLENLGSAYDALGRINEAVDCRQKALSLKRKTRNKISALGKQISYFNNFI